MKNIRTWSTLFMLEDTMFQCKSIEQEPEGLFQQRELENETINSERKERRPNLRSVLWIWSEILRSDLHYLR